VGIRLTTRSAIGWSCSAAHSRKESKSSFSHVRAPRANTLNFPAGKCVVDAAEPALEREREHECDRSRRLYALGFLSEASSRQFARPPRTAQRSMVALSGFGSPFSPARAGIPVSL
jgi:hypothetical protein